MKKLFSFILLSLLLGNVFAQVPTNGLVAYYPFTGNANDNSGNGYDGSVNGAILASDRFGNSDGAYQFDGSSTSIYVNNFPAFFQSGPFAISLWIKSTGQSNSSYDLQHMIAYGNPNQRSAHSFSYAYSYTKSPSLNNTYFNYYDVTNGSYFPNEGGYKAKDRWVHLVIVYDGTKMKNYINGVLEEEFVKSPISVNSGTSLIIGGFPATNQYFKGYLDDIRVYSRSLSNEEVSALFIENCSTAFSTAPAIQFDGSNLTATSYPSASYVWSYNGNEVTGQTSNNFTGTLNAGQYEVTVSNSGCLASATYALSADASNLTNGLLVNLPLSGDINDVSGNNYNGAILDASLANPIYVNDRFNQPNGAIQFSNRQTNGVKIAGQNGQFPLNSSFSVSVWVKTLDDQFNSYVGHGIGGQGVMDQTFFMNYQKSASNANLWAGLYSDDLSHDEPNGNSSEWDHIVTTYERKENGTSVISIYRNNILLAQKTDANLYNGNGSLYLGQISFDNELTPFNRPNAALDDFKVFNRVINTSEINALYTEGCSATFTTAPTIQFDGTNLTATEYAGAQYVWSYNSNIVTDQTTKDFTGTLNAGEYSVNISSGSCSATASYSLATDVVKLSNGLRAYYPFNGDASDASGNGNDGQLDGSPVLTADPLGQANKAFEFNGSNRILVPNSASLNVTNGISFSTWIKQTGVNAPGYPGSVANYGSVLIDKAVWGAPDGGYRLDARGQSHVTGKRMRFILDGTVSEASNDHEIDQWQHLVVTYDLTSTKYYLNGVLVSEEPLAKNSIIGNNFDLALGGPNSTGLNATGFNFVGSMDEVRIYDRALNSAEVKQLNCEFTPALVSTIDGKTESCTNSTEFYSLSNASSVLNYEWVVTGGTIEDKNASVAKVTWTGAGAQSISLNYTTLCNTGTLSTNVNVGTGITCGLELYLPFDGDATDASGNSRDGVVTNGSYVNNRFQKATKSLNLDGNGSGVTFGSYQGYKGDGKGSFTIGTWFKAQPNGETRIISNGMNGNNKGYFIGVGANGTLRFAMGNEFGDGSGNFANSVIFNTQNTSYADNNWHYVVTVVDREQNKITLVVDGAVQPIALFESSGGTIQSDNSVDITGLNISAETSSFLSIGKFESYGYLIGDIDELKIYSRPLNSQEIQSLYTDGCPGFDAPSISYSSSTYCNTGSASPTGSFANGSFSSTEGLVIDATTGVVDLAASTAGEYTVTYTIPAQYGCSAQTATASIEITEVTNTTAVTALCADGTSTKALAGSSNITEWHITPAALASNISNNTFTAPTAAASVSVYATDVNGCQSPTVSFEVNGLPTITNTETSVIVGGTLNLTGTDGNTWSITSGNVTLVNNVLTAGNAPSTNVVVKYTNDQTGCFVEKSFTINSLYITADASTYDCGQNPFYVTVQIGSNAVSGIIGGDVILNYDPTVMKPTGNYVIGSVAEGQGSGIVDMNDTGTQILAGISYPDNSSFQGQGDVISFEFKLETGVVEGEYTMPSGTFTESYAVGYRDLEVKAGKLTVIHFYPTLQGKIQYRENANLPVFNNANPASGVTTVYAAENCVNTGTTTSPSATGEFSILMPDKDFTLKITRTIPEGTEVDNTINGFDAVVASRITNGKIASPSVYQLISADVNGDTRILAADKTLILNRAVLNSSTFAAGDWKFFPSTKTFSNFDKNNVPSIDACMPVPSKIENGCTAFDVQTYNAVLIGDVNGNYATTPNGANLRAEASATLATLDFSRATQPLTGVYRVPVMVSCDSTVYSVDATLDYNSTWVSNARVIAAAVQGSYSMASSVKNSRVRISSAFNDTLKKAEPAMYVEFTTTNIDSVKISYLKVLLNGEIVPSQVNKAARVTSIEEQEAQISNLAVYPNPSASGTFHVDFSSLGKDGASVVVMDLMGKVVYQSNNNLVSNTTIDLSAYDSGTYLMKITTGAVTKVKSIVIEK